ncbi:hypothetical protein MRX96_056142 [Rhipicephalus microplus]
MSLEPIKRRRQGPKSPTGVRNERDSKTSQHGEGTRRHTRLDRDPYRWPPAHITRHSKHAHLAAQSATSRRPGPGFVYTAIETGFCGALSGHMRREPARHALDTCADLCVWRAQHVRAGVT